MIEIDMGKAREIVRDRIRAHRAPLLAALDVKFQRAVEDGSSTAPIVDQKQRLRDLTKHPDIAAAPTPAALSAALAKLLATE